MCELDLYFIGLSEIHWVCGQDLSKIHQLLWKLRLCSCGRAANPDCHLKGEVKAKIKISPVVVFGVLSRMVLVRGS